MMFAQLGEIIFRGRRSFSEFVQTRRATYAEITRIEGKPLIQRTGDDLDDYSLSIYLHYEFSNIEQDLEQLEQARAQGTILPLILGTGEVLGEFVLESIQKNYRNTDADGRLVDCQIEIGIKEFVDPDPEATAARRAEAQAFALEENNPAGVSATTSISDPAQALHDINDAKSQAQAVNNDVNEAATVVSRAKQARERARKRLQQMEQGLERARNTVQQAQAEIRNAERLVEDLQAARDAASNLKNGISLSSIDDLLSANRSMQSAVSRTNGSAQGLTAQSGGRSL